MRWLNTDGRHGTPFYCSGRPRPLFRGVFHVFCALTSPVWTLHQVSLCRNTDSVLPVLISCFGTTSCFGASGAYHRLPFRTEEQELTAGLLDYCGIYLQIAFSCAPAYFNLLPAPYGWYVIFTMAAFAIAGIVLTFSPIGADRPEWRHVGTFIFNGMGAVQLLPFLSTRMSERTMWSQLADHERVLLVSGLLSYLVGSQIYSHATPKLWPRIFGFHELWHVLVVIGAACTYLVNCSLLMRL